MSAEIEPTPVRRRSVERRRVMGFIEYADGHGAYGETSVSAPISEAHYKRGQRLRDARVAARLTLKGHADRANLPGLSLADLSQIQMGIAEATEAEWAALWSALGRDERFAAEEVTS